MNTWKLTYRNFIPGNEPLREALTTLGNGYFGTRGAACESHASEIHYPGTYITGVYNKLPTKIFGKTIYNEDLVNCPNWLVFNYKINDGPWFSYLESKIMDYRVELNMNNGILTRRFRFKDNRGHITFVRHKRIVSMADPHIGSFCYTFTPENYSGKIMVRSGIDGEIKNEGIERYKELNNKHLKALSAGKFGKDGLYQQSRTTQGKIRISESIRTLFYEDNVQKYPKFKVIKNDKSYCSHEFSFNAKKGHHYNVEKLLSIYTSRDQGVPDDLKKAIEKVSQIENFNQVSRDHKAKWKAIWSRFDIEVTGDDFMQNVLRMHIFHLLQSASTHNEDIDAGMPARGLHGEAYRGHIFWDELYIFPFFNLHAPEITRAFLMYRYRRLEAAKAYAAMYGHKGAMFPWQSASTGEETTQAIHLNPLSGTWGPDYSFKQRHVSIAVAYNAWSYYYSTGDIDFLECYGAEIIVEVACFLSSITQYNKKTKRYEIKGVMGPDEYHEKYPDSEEGGLNNNAYTNIMAVWVIEKALLTLDHLLSKEASRALLLKTGIDGKELSRWRDIIHKMTVPISKNGIIHQFEGYMKLKELNWDKYREKSVQVCRIDRILKAEGKSPDEYKVSKQPDVLMLFYVLNMKELKFIFNQLGYRFGKNILKKNFDYYYPRTSHGSTLSIAVHSCITSLLNDNEKTMELFSIAMESDIHDIQGGSTNEGIHTGVMGATINIFLRVFAGLDVLEDRICIKPNLPEGWKSIKFQVRYKNIWFKFDINSSALKVKAEPMHKLTIRPSNVIPVVINKNVHKLHPEKTYTIIL